MEEIYVFEFVKAVESLSNLQKSVYIWHVIKHDSGRNPSKMSSKHFTDEKDYCSIHSNNSKTIQLLL